MATVHNAYYQSPWIETASRNLASALAPPDPEKQFAQRAAEWKFGRMQELAAIEDTDRATKHQIEDYRAEMLRPVLNPVTGQIDQELTNAKILKNWADAIDLGDDPDVGAKLSGELNPEVAVKRALTEIAARNKLGLADFNWGRRGALQDDAQAATADESSKARQFTAEQNALRFKNYLDGINLRNKQSGKGEPNEIPVPIIKEITFGLDDFIFATGRDMSLEKYNQFAERVGKRWQRNGNVQQSLNEQWAESFPNSRSYAGAEAEPDTNTWYGGTNRGKLNPYFSDEPSQYSDAFVPGAAPPAAAPSAAPPAAEKPKPKPAGTTAPPPKKRRPIESFGR